MILLSLIVYYCADCLRNALLIEFVEQDFGLEEVLSEVYPLLKNVLADELHDV